MPIPGCCPSRGERRRDIACSRPGAVPRARLVRTLRQLGIGLDDIRHVLSAEATLADVAAAHLRALDVQVRTLRLQRAVLTAVIRSTNPQELERMTDLTNMTSEERRRILDDYLQAVFEGADEDPVARRLRMGAPELPEDPTGDQVAAWIEIVSLLRDPDYIAACREMALRAQAEGPLPDAARVDLAEAVGEHGGAAVRAGIDRASRQALAVVEKIEAASPAAHQDRAAAAERIEAFTDRRVARYWTLVAVLNDWPQAGQPPAEDLIDAWEWYASALRAHAREG